MKMTTHSNRTEAFRQNPLASQNRVAITPPSYGIDFVDRRSAKRVDAGAPAPWVQAKLTVGAPNDKFERQADRVADQVMRMPPPAAGPAVPGSGGEEPIRRMRAEDGKALHRQPMKEDEKLQRQPREEEELHRQPLEEEEPVQAKAGSGDVPRVDDATAAEISSLRGGGQPLPESARAFFEPRFGRDFSPIRVHADPAATTLARKVQARAFTVGRDIVFGQGQYAPDTGEGRNLLAHELTHTIQQTNREVR